MEGEGFQGHGAALPREGEGDYRQLRTAAHGRSGARGARCICDEAPGRDLAKYRLARLVPACSCKNNIIGNPHEEIAMTTFRSNGNCVPAAVEKTAEEVRLGR